MPANSDFKDLLKIFNARHVKYLIIGGYAVVYYTEPRYTKDLDIWIDENKENAASVYAALTEFGAPLKGLTPEDFSKPGYTYQIGIAPSRIDIIMADEGLAFADAWSRRVDTYFDDVPVRLISRKDLITLKSASGRPRDRLDLDALAEAGKTARKPSKPARKRKSGPAV